MKTIALSALCATTLVLPCFCSAQNVPEAMNSPRRSTGDDSFGAMDTSSCPLARGRWSLTVVLIPNSE